MAGGPQRRPVVILHPGRDARVRAGHLWVYRTEIARVEGAPADGDAVSVVTSAGRPLGMGLLNTRSQIAVRLLAPEATDLDEGFFRARLERALALRARIVSDSTACRLVFSEGDFLPGLIVDRYGDVLVVQTLTLGMDRRKEMLVRLLSDLAGPRRIYARNDPAVRLLEGLPRERGWLVGGGPTELEIEENGLRFVVDIERGQKSGFFLDQRENRRHLAELAAGGDVLECFAYTGAWGIHAARYGARSVLGIEASEEAVELAGRNAALNGVEDRCRVIQGNAFDELRRVSGPGPPSPGGRSPQGGDRPRGGERFDVVILDPPAFVRNRGALASGLAGYKEINLRALKALRPGGWLITCSCSYHVDEARLRDTVFEASRDAGRRIRIVESRSQARDHPVHPAMPETRYLKCLVLAVD